MCMPTLTLYYLRTLWYKYIMGFHNYVTNNENDWACQVLPCHPNQRSPKFKDGAWRVHCPTPPACHTILPDIETNNEVLSHACHACESFLAIRQLSQTSITWCSSLTPHLELGRTKCCIIIPKFSLFSNVYPRSCLCFKVILVGLHNQLR